ncbi:MAG: SDR family oxidoreductase [Alphaproteobacteria bacterium]|nr:SDR family oxidoreductase [Alphaproteobacteria bacterium]
MSREGLFIFGLGYVGKALGRVLMAKGWRVVGTTRSDSHAQNLKDEGFDALVWDGQSPLPSEAFKGITHSLITIPPDEEGDIVLRHVAVEKIPSKWIGYVSATSVYGDHRGAWVTEDASLNPISLRGRQRLLAETQWLEKRAQFPDFPIHIFRLSGIYGPARSVLESIRAGSAVRIDKPGHVFSRIHIEDIIAVLMASMANPLPGDIYNLADDEPASTADVIAYGCSLLGVEAPPLIPIEEADLSMAMREFYKDLKRVSNQKIKETLGVQLKYPTYREGLKHC